MKNLRLPLSRAWSKDGGFTLLEAFVAIALMSVLLATLATITGHWLRNWKAGLERVQNADLLALGLDRIVADLAAAEFEGPSGENARPLFVGTTSSVTFVRTAIGPNATAGLEIVRLAETEDARGPVLVRARSPFAQAAAEAIDTAAIEFTNPIILVRPPYRVSFAFAGPDRVWQEVWQNAKELPNAVRISVRDAAANEILPASTATLLNVNAPAQSVAGDAAATGAGAE